MKTKQPKVTIKPISDIKFRADNPRSHSAENLDLIKNSLTRNKAGRSILIDENNESLAGEGTTRSAIEAGIKEVIIIEATGDQLVAVKRTDLSEDQKAEMIMFDNRANELSEWDQAKTAEMLIKLKDNGIALSTFHFSDADLEHMRMNANFDDKDFEQFFTPNDNHHSSDPTKFTIALTYPVEQGKAILEVLKSINDKPEVGLSDLIDMAKTNKLI